MTTKKNKKLKDDLFLKPFENEMFLRKNLLRILRIGLLKINYH